MIEALSSQAAGASSSAASVRQADDEKKMRYALGCAIEFRAKINNGSRHKQKGKNNRFFNRRCLIL